VCQELTNEVHEAYAETAPRIEDNSLQKSKDFEENLAEAVYEGLSWASSVVAPLLDMYVKDALTAETGFRKTKLSIQDCECLAKGLEKAFGFGAIVVETKILKILHSKLGVSKPVEADFKFTGELRMVKHLHHSKLQAQNPQ